MVESTQTAQSGLLRWRVVDVTVTAVIAVASGVVFWGLGMVTVPLSTLMQVVPGLQALTRGLFLLRRTLGCSSSAQTGSCDLC